MEWYIVSNLCHLCLVRDNAAMLKLMTHLMIAIIVLHLPWLAAPRLIVPDLVVLILITAKLQNPKAGFWLLAIVAGLGMDIMGGTPYGFTSVQYIGMLGLVSCFQNILAKASIIPIFLWFAFSYCAVNLITVWLLTQSTGHMGNLNLSVTYATLLTIAFFPICYNFLRYNVKKYA